MATCFTKFDQFNNQNLKLAIRTDIHFMHVYLCQTQGSHSSWKTWKNDNSFSSPGKVLEFYNFIKNPGKWE